MDIVLWIVQVLLALAFLAAGAMKLTQPKSRLVANLKWAEDFSESNIKLIGLAEVLGALGLVLPMWTGILPWLTPLAAAGLAVLMIGASATHFRRKETMVPSGVLGVLAVLVGLGRFGG
ncbi:MAG: DoxX family protein [Meiothermus sp.]|nr:DoxX family protein [Meiothermus sp.]